ncbi:unnamed protein product [Nippostrongylus brasiliensis]|uniref:t-SNARE coiled-coil homology domain-containing protein n=1 Tax=Nippostrongylus brasiliensis TaxID=27835 RepID=A0A0N4YVM5_NIPBR|nr:unnamed protein product [Nippostrongylus brasiliensis]
MSYDIDHEIRLMELEHQANLYSIAQTLNIMSGRLGSIFNKVAQMQDDVRTILERTTPSSNYMYYQREYRSSSLVTMSSLQ